MYCRSSVETVESKVILNFGRFIRHYRKPLQNYPRSNPSEQKEMKRGKHLSDTEFNRFFHRNDNRQGRVYFPPLVYLFHMSPKIPAPLGMDCSSKLALRAAALSLAGSRFIVVILLNISPDCRMKSVGSIVGQVKRRNDVRVYGHPGRHA